MSDDVKILISITGVDFYLASLISSFIGDVERFPSDDHLASFFGIVPTSRDSADVKRRGRMSKHGSSIARWALSVMVDTVMLRNETIREYYSSVKKRTGSGKLAHVSTIKKLTRMLYHMLKTKQHWKWENPQLTERKMARLEMGGGDVCNMNDDLGTLEVGKIADVLVVDGDPLHDLHALSKVRWVIHNGTMIRSPTSGA